MQRARVDVLLTLVLVALPTTACGTDPATSGDGPGARQQVSEADQACRDRWHDLGSTVATQAARGGMVKQVFASRWDSIAAGVWLKFALSPAPRAPLLSHIRHCHARGLSRE